MIGPEARGAWRELERHLRPYLGRRVPSAADVDDLLQDIFERLHAGVAGLRDDERFGPWVYRVASSAVIDRARRRARAPELAHDVSQVSAPETDADDRLQRELGECVALFVSRLPSPYREAITLTELEGLTQQQAADMLGLSLSGMKSRVQRGREKIRQMFDACCVMALDARGRVVECEPRALEQIPADCRAAAGAWLERRR